MERTKLRFTQQAPKPGVAPLDFENVITHLAKPSWPTQSAEGPDMLLLIVLCLYQCYYTVIFEKG